MSSTKKSTVLFPAALKEILPMVALVTTGVALPLVITEATIVDPAAVGLASTPST
jgi:hypothetical protein